MSVALAYKKESMTDLELAGLLSQLETQAVGYLNSEIATEQAKAIKYYYREPFGDEQEGRSQVVDGTVAVTVDNAIAAILKPFVSSDDAVAFEPTSAETEEQAKQATEYVNYIFYKDNPGFLIMHDWVKDGCLSKLGIVKTWWEDWSGPKREEVTGMDAQGLEMLLGQAQMPNADFKITEGPFRDDGEFFSLTIEQEHKDGRVKIMNVPPEEFLISPFARSLETTSYCAHRTRKSRSDLIEMGFDEDVVEGLSKDSLTTEWDSRSQARYQDEQWAGSFNDQTPDRSQDMIAVIDEFIKVDYDGDGLSELRQIIRSDQTILYNEVVDDNPFATWCPVPMPHKVYGLSMADQTMDLQRISSVVWRQTLDNLYLSNNPRPEIPQSAERDDGSTIDDILDNSPGAAIRTKQAGMLNFFTVPFAADKSFSMLSFIAQQAEARTGISLAGQGLSPEALKKNSPDTATQASIEEGRRNSRPEMTARIFAETGLKTLFRKVLKLVIKHQPKERIIRLRKKWVPIDPRGWDAEMDMTVNVGLGVGNKLDQIAQANAVLETQEALAMTPYATLITEENVYNAVKAKFAAAGARNIDDILTEPEKGPDGQPKPKTTQPSPEAIKAQADAEAQKAKLEMEGQKSAMQLQQSQAEGEAKIQLMREEAAAKLQLERDKAASEAELAQQKFAMESRLAEQQMLFEAEMARQQADRQHEVAMKQADAKISQNRPGGDLDK